VQNFLHFFKRRELFYAEFVHLKNYLDLIFEIRRQTAFFLKLETLYNSKKHVFSEKENQLK